MRRTRRGWCIVGAIAILAFGGPACSCEGEETAPFDPGAGAVPGSTRSSASE
ncbi:hypothetical protein K8I61_11710 [bacterium]|nr:hypothetical protein [bacterium]